MKQTNEDDSEEPGRLHSFRQTTKSLPRRLSITHGNLSARHKQASMYRQYDGKSVDWNEKKQALAYATGLPQDSMIFLED